jgi:hypothetical protein
MPKIIARIEGHYEVHEAPFSRSYEWHPSYVTLECDCGEELTLASPSPISTTCRCGTDHSAIIKDIQEVDGRLGHEVTHPWQHDTQQQKKQHLLNEDTYPENSPWRYNDVTAENKENV